MNLRALVPAFLVSAVVGAGERERSRLAELRANWGREIARKRNLEVISRYHASAAAGRRTVDERTWQDLGLDDLFGKLDRTVSMPGRQVLYHQLRTYEEGDGPLAERARQQAVFKDEPELREKLQLLFSRLDGPRSEWLASSLLVPIPTAPRFAPLLYLCSFLSLAGLVGMIFVHWLFLPLLPLLLVNVAITATYGQRVTPSFSGFAQIVTMLGVGERLAAMANPRALPQLEALKEKMPALRRLQRRLGWLVMDRAALPDLAESLLGYLNMLFLFDIVVYLRSIAALRQHQPALLELFEAIGALDSAIAVASYLQGAAVVTRPGLVAGRHLEFSGLYHPLIAAPVSNALQLTGRSALIAGPNMAGKTAFIRSVGINVILAQTLGFAHAEHARLPRATVRSAIRREDDLNSGQSYFFAEIRQILEFTQAEEAGGLNLFLIDEIFRGTNTVERVAASAAVLHHLGRHHLVLATTHDVELQDLLADAFDMYHFSDRVADGTYSFDYRIHPGPARSRNAIKLLEISGYPAAIIREAEALAARASRG
ncbi:MAG TPA: hypothetical protein VG838_12675 [Opitutaceae bacterium]|nr:hypothetical protein [Opitutaceae bacterium]